MHRISSIVLPTKLNFRKEYDPNIPLELSVAFKTSSSGWWFQPIEKIVKMEIFPKYRGEHKQMLETTI